jgi:hypothetical protein
MYLQSATPGNEGLDVEAEKQREYGGAGGNVKAVDAKASRLEGQDS